MAQMQAAYETARSLADAAQPMHSAAVQVVLNGCAKALDDIGSWQSGYSC